MLTAADRLILQALRIERWRQSHPRISPFFHSVELDKLILNVEASSITPILIRSSDYLLQDAAIILGVSKLEILQSREFMFAIKLQSEATFSTQDTEMATATLTAEQQNNRAIEFQPVEEQSLVIPWSQITKTIGASEDELKAQLTSARIPFMWAENKEWGILEDDAVLLIKKFYEAQAAVATQKMRAATQGKSETSPLEEGKLETDSKAQAVAIKEKAPAKKRSSGNSKPVKLTTEFKPVKNLFETVKRFVEAITTDTNAQMVELGEIIGGTARGKKFLKLALDAYEPGTAPSEGELISTFVRLRDRRIKEANKTPQQHQPTDPQGEEIAQN